MFTGLTRNTLPWWLFLAGLAPVFMATWLARRRRPGGECGDYWSRVTLRLCLLLGPLLLLSSWLETLLPDYWRRGWHLYLDVTGAFGWPASTCYALALGSPFALWLIVLVVGLARRPGPRERARWLAGGTGFRNSGGWIGLCALPLLLILMATVTELGGGQAAYPAAVWSTLAVVILSLLGVAYSAGRLPLPDSSQLKVEGPGPDQPLQPSSERLAACGIKLRTLAAWPASTPSRPVRGAAAQELAKRLQWCGARAVAPELIEAVAGLLESPWQGDEQSPLHLVFAPDNCGQAETVSRAAEWLEQRLHALTLVITATDAAGLAARLQGRLPDHDQRVWALTGAGDIPADALLVVVDAEFLSDRLLPLLKNPLTAKRIGMVVWWDLHHYTGVMGANLWAISRRLHGLLRQQGRRDVRTLALIRSAPHGSAQLAEFVRRLLPHPPTGAAEFHVETRFPRPLNLYWLDAQQQYLARPDNRHLPHRLRQPLLLAAKASVEIGWPTCLEAPPDITHSELEAWNQLPVTPTMGRNQVVLGEQLHADSSTAGARLLPLHDSDILALLELISQGGRAAIPENLPHHVAITRPDNPYALWLLASLTERGHGFTASRRLICAEAHPSIIRRHLLLALNELPDTRTGLLKSALWEEKVVQETLDDIAFQGQLSQREVRFLDDSGQLVRELEYKSQILPGAERRPLDTVGLALIEVRDPAGAYESEGVRLRVDPERLLIKAYPRRVFMHAGQRYRIRDWYSVEEVRERGWLECRREDQYSLTWRMRNVYTFGINPLPSETTVAIGQRGRFLNRLAVDLDYEEEVIGVLSLTAIPDDDAALSPTWKTDESHLAQPLRQSFSTRALVLCLSEPTEAAALIALCQALRHVLPVQLGVVEDALEVVALHGDIIAEQQTFGIAIVDLYPGGIGLIDAIHDDNAWILQLLEFTRDWLAACTDDALLTPAARAANPYQPPQRSAALELLRQVL